MVFILVIMELLNLKKMHKNRRFFAIFFKIDTKLQRFSPVFNNFEAVLMSFLAKICGSIMSKIKE